MQDLAGATLGNYQVLECLRTGGMAVVYRAIQQPLGREVALKVLAPALVDQEGFMQRFENEARTVARLDHPHILPVYDFGSISGITFLTMPLIKGGTLRTLLDNGALDRSEAWRYINEMGDALHHTHEVGVVHRDLKPSNVLIHTDGRSLLTDFGLARVGVTPSALSIYGFTLGTPGYMAPEQAMGRDVDRRADIYSLGVLIFEMLTGTTPYSADSPMGLVMATVNAPIPSAHARNSALPVELDAVLAKALAKDPAQRHQTAAELLSDLADLPMRRLSAPASAQAATATVALSGESPAADFQLRTPVPVPAGLAAGSAAAAVGFPPPQEPAMAADLQALRAMQASAAAAEIQGAMPSPVAEAFGSRPGRTAPPPSTGSEISAALASARLAQTPLPLSTGAAVAVLEQMGLPHLHRSRDYALSSYFAIAAAAARQVSGEYWPQLLQTAGLPEYIEHDPAGGNDRSIPIEDFSRLNEAFELLFDADAAPRLREWGRLTTHRWLASGWAGRARRRAIRFMPGNQRKLALLLKFHVEGMDRVRGERLHAWKQIGQNQFWLVHFSNLYALGRRKRERACEFWTESFRAMLRWAGLANDWVVDEIECGCVTGSHDCVFALRSVR